MRALSVRLAAAAVAAGVVVAGAAVPSPASGFERDRGYAALIRRASYGVPHITAGNFAGLGFGVGYVQAEDNICVIAEDVVTVSGERSRWFGAAGPDDANVRSDLFHRKAIDERVVDRLLEGPRDGVRSPSDDVRDQMRGFVAGYNHFLRRTGVQNITDPACRGKAWVRPLTVTDVWRTSWASMVRAGSRALLDGIVSATPPAAAGSATAAEAPDAAAVVAALDGASAGIGSNAYGLGARATTSGNGMVLANPHFPWQGSERFYRMHLKVPGRYDVEGAALIGDPIIEIGHNRTVAWSHTVSTARRFVWHRLSLVPGDPTSYYVDGRPEKMRARTVTVQAGAAGAVSRTLYDTRYGPVVVVPGTFDWTAGTAYAITDVNAGNNRSFDGWLRMGQAKDVRQLKAVLDRHQFLPWVNVIAADARGEALYGDHSVIPRVTDALAAACIPAAFQPLYAGSGQAVLDGSRSDCALGRDPDAAAPGILGPANLPVRFRDDYVTNSNDSHWLANPAAPLEGYPRIIGNERTERSLRTRLGIDQIQQRLAGTDGLPGKRFTTERLWQTTFGNRVHGAELVRDDLVALCRREPLATASNGATVDLTAACEALARFDLRVNLDSRGAHLFSEFALAGGIRFADTFDVSDPVRTPRRLNTQDPRVRTALADAVQRLAGIPLDAKLGDIHTDTRGHRRIPIHGGRGEAGVFNVITNPLVPGVGYPKVVHGSSFVMAVELGRHGPSGRQILTYSQSTNPNSPWYADQTSLYSRKGWDTIKYTEAQIAADPNLRTYVVAQRGH
ncbi:putative cyclic lipopeptide acylase [Actinoplanes missouriensis 431]|uniref:Putative cyclic lipopeptide acylase n=1 Tax=Actinoplanes missouriensis (strain ATCC 14538 / DSM 43046 / CBS 188.64 / JCM 3121 / NBRC 102363 / NCIMB 12654 / NRRL B-3342 / UNCC 431) TaxID=512565 RepID=I0H4Z1_ACTM4|nr:putative cyclic lipopeptide acylase [Actinoplanes missouriensis 431]